MAKFFIRTKKQSGTATLWTRVQRPANNIDLWINSGIKVNVESWNRAQSRPERLTAYYNTPEGAEVQSKIRDVEQIITLALNEGITDKAGIESRVNRVATKEASDKIAELERQEAEAEAQKSHQILNYYDLFIEGITEGHILHGSSKEYTEGTLRVWRDFGRYLKAYTPEGMTFEDIDARFAADFKLYLKKQGLMSKTVSKYTICFRRLCNSAADSGSNDSFKSVRVWGERVIKDSEKRVEIALTDDEIDALYDMPLTGIREQARDLWMLGYFSAQRVSDFARLRSSNFKTADGVEYIHLTQQKTGVTVKVPVTDDRVNELCRKYDYNFPSVDRRFVNRYIKLICHDLSAEVPSLREMVPTVLTMAENAKEQWYMETCKRVESGERLHGEEMNSGECLYRRDGDGSALKARWECVSCHTTRRSAITNLYDAEVLDTKDIMSVSGHTSIRNFENYIRRDDIRQVKSVAAKLKAAKELAKLKKQA